MRAAIAAAIALGLTASQPDAARVLADMRQALGGEAALAAVRAFSVSGSASIELDDRAIRSLGPDLVLAKARNSGVSGGDPGTWPALDMEQRVTVDWTAVLPDSSVVVRRMSPASWGRETVTAIGFRSDQLIARSEGDDEAFLHPSASATPAQRAAAEADFVRFVKRESSMRALALIGQPAFDASDISYEEQRIVAGRLCDVLRLRSSDDSLSTLAVDAATHLPVRVSWMGPAGYLMASVSTSFTQSGHAPPGISPFPPPMSPAGTSPTTVPGHAPAMKSVEYEVFFDDFKLVEGLKWPHRITSKIPDLYVETTRVKKYKLNPKINPKIFEPSRR